MTAGLGVSTTGVVVGTVQPEAVQAAWSLVLAGLYIMADGACRASNLNTSGESILDELFLPPGSPSAW